MNIVDILGKVMNLLYNIINNYGVAIILFTLFSKIVLLPISIWVQKNSIKMVKMQPSINKIKIKYFGDKNTIAEEETKLYKKEKYNAFASLIPLAVQIILLLGLVEVINKPMKYIANIPDDYSSKFVNVALENHKDLNEESSSLQLTVVKDIKNNNISNYNKIKNDIGEKEYNKIVKDIKKLNLKFLGFDMGWIASNEKSIAYLVPILAGISALLLCICQNIMNVLQAQQSLYNKYGMLIFSVGLSLYLGMFVPAGVALYWIFSNLFAIIQQWILNIFINPKKYVDYEELEKTTEELKKLQSLNKKHKRTREQKIKEKKDYKRFFSVINKHLVFYSESNGFYKYYKGIIEYILKNTNIVIHYITSDYNDDIFKLEKENKNIKAYYIEEKKLITLMMKMDADVVVMTMPDLDNYHIKRSYIRKDIEYIFIPHSLDSLNLTMRNSSMNNYDTVFVTGKYQEEEALKINEMDNLKNRKIVKWGYTLLDDMIENYKPLEQKNKNKTILIAPSWQKDNIVDLVLEDILNNLKGKKYDIIVRPHPQHVRHMKEKFEQLNEFYKKDNIIIQTDFSNNETVFNADLLITDWSGIAYEYSFTTKKPVLFINTPMKIMNPEYEKTGIEPFNIWTRDVIGKSLDIDNIDNIEKIVDEIFKNNVKYKKAIIDLLNDSVYNIGDSSKIGAEYIINCIVEKIRERKEKEK